MDPSKRYFTYYEYMAAKLYYDDAKLHLLLDQADSGIYLEEGGWEVGIRNPANELKFSHLWDLLSSEKKDFYLKMAHHDLYSQQPHG